MKTFRNSFPSRMQEVTKFLNLNLYLNFQRATHESLSIKLIRLTYSLSYLQMKTSNIQGNDLSFVQGHIMTSHLFRFQSGWYPGILLQGAATVVVRGGVALGVVIESCQAPIVVDVTCHVMWLRRTFTVLADFSVKYKKPRRIKKCVTVQYNSLKFSQKFDKCNSRMLHRCQNDFVSYSYFHQYLIKGIICKDVQMLQIP